MTEAGGKGPGAKGQKIVYGGPAAKQEAGSLATNGKLHEEALKRIGACVTPKGEMVEGGHWRARLLAE